MSKFQGREKNKYNYLAQFTPTTQWNNDKIPPLISLNTKPQIKQSQISIQSINQSEVKSVYTIDKEDFDKQVLDILNPSTERTFKEARTQKNIKNIHTTQPDIKSFETPVSVSKEKFKMESKVEEVPKNVYQYNKNEYDKCNAVNLYRQLVQQNLQKHSESQQNERRELEWIKAKSPTQMLASVLTNPSRMDLYVHSLLKEIHLNEKAKLINQLHQQEIEPYNPTLKQVYTDILCLLTKINAPKTKKYYINHQKNPERGKSSSKQKEVATISLFQNGLQIDLNPKLTAVRKKNAENIRELKQKINQTQLQIKDTKKIYEEIIFNFAITIQNLNKGEEPEGTLHSPLQQSSVRLLIAEQEDEIRKKNHTFGMKDFTRDPSRNFK